MTLHDYAVHHGSDKGKYHKYCDFYEARIGDPKRIIEFGVLDGASLKMWRDRYPGTVVIGLDIEDKKAPDGTYTFKIDASKESWITKLQPTFDLIIDDASHFTHEQISIFDLWWPLVASGGHYIIEDCHTMHYDHYNPEKIDFKAWVKSLGIKHEWYWRVEGDESDSGTLIFYK
jgi:trans-aconitate methyltransferase